MGFDIKCAQILLNEFNKCVFLTNFYAFWSSIWGFTQNKKRFFTFLGLIC